MKEYKPELIKWNLHFKRVTSVAGDNELQRNES